MKQRLKTEKINKRTESYTRVYSTQVWVASKDVLAKTDVFYTEFIEKFPSEFEVANFNQSSNKPT